MLGASFRVLPRLCWSKAGLKVSAEIRQRQNLEEVLGIGRRDLFFFLSEMARSFASPRDEVKLNSRYLFFANRIHLGVFQVRYIYIYIYKYSVYL